MEPQNIPDAPEGYHWAISDEFIGLYNEAEQYGVYVPIDGNRNLSAWQILDFYDPHLGIAPEGYYWKWELVQDEEDEE